MGFIGILRAKVAVEVPWAKLAHEQVLGVTREVSFLNFFALLIQGDTKIAIRFLSRSA